MNFLTSIHTFSSIQKASLPPPPPPHTHPCPCLRRRCMNVPAQVESLFPLYSHRLNLAPHLSVWVTLPSSPIGVTRICHPRSERWELSHLSLSYSGWHSALLSYIQMAFIVHIHSPHLIKPTCVLGFINLILQMRKSWLCPISTGKKCLMLKRRKKQEALKCLSNQCSSKKCLLPEIL